MKLSQQRKHSSSDEDAITIFNHIKETYSQKIDELTELKRIVFQTDQIEQQQRSKLRITIESLLIDLNEEIFSISEELAKSFTFERQKNLYQKAQEFEQRKEALMLKIKQTIDQNQSVKILRRHQKIASFSPPSRDLNTFGMQTQETTINAQYHNKQQSTHKKQNSSPGVQLKKNFSASKQRNEGFNTQTDNSVRNEVLTTTELNSKHSLPQRSSIPRKKSPIPLRRKDTGTLQTEGTHRQHSNSSRKVSQNSSKKQLFQKENKKDTQLKKNIKKLEEFEKYLAKKQGGQALQQSANKENRPSNDDQISTIQLQSEAFDNFAQEFAHMKSKFLQMQQRMMDQEEKQNELEQQVDKLKTENLKLTTDVKIIRNEHSEILHSLFTLEKKNTQLTQENQALKRILTGERELKGQETNLPKPYLENNNRPASNDRKQSPFSSFLQKNRSFSHLRESKDSNISLVKPTNDIANNTQKNFNFRGDNNNDFVSFQPSMDQTYKNLSNQQDLDDRRNQYNQMRSSAKNWPSSHHNPLLSVSNERPGPLQNANNSFAQLQQQTLTQIPSRILSIPQSRRGGEQPLYSRMHETPTTPDHINANVITDETPGHNQDYLQRGQRTFNNGSKRLTPTSSSQQYLGTGTNDPNLSDWVLERLNKRIQ